MIFVDFDNLSSKILAIGQIEHFYFNPEDVEISDLRGAKARKLDLDEVKHLWVLYSQAYHTQTQMACVECREHKMIQLEIEFGKFLEKLNDKYGG